jgi:hypothetical protein
MVNLYRDVHVVHALQLMGALTPTMTSKNATFKMVRKNCKNTFDDIKQQVATNHAALS